MSFNINTLIAYVINLLLGIIGFLLVASYNRTNETLAQINRDVLSLNKEILGLKIKLTEVTDRMLTDERVRELIRMHCLRNNDVSVKQLNTKD